MTTSTDDRTQQAETRPDIRNPAPPHVVLPSLILGAGRHGTRVVERFARALHDADPNLVEIVQTANVYVVDQSLRLESSRARVEVPLDGTDLDPGLTGSAGALREPLQALCDSIGIHERLQRLAERGYTPFAEGGDLAIRVYLLGDLEEPGSAMLLTTLREALQHCRQHRQLRCSTIVVVPDDDTQQAQMQTLLSDPDAESFQMNRLYVTSRVKQHGFLTSSPAELELAHALFLQAMVLSNAELEMDESLSRGSAVGTFGVASIRVGTSEMIEWLEGRLALRVIREGYLAAWSPPRTGPESRADETRLQIHIDNLWRDLSTERIALSSDAAPRISLSDASPLAAWCAEEVDRRVASPPAPHSARHAETTDARHLVAPLENVFMSLRERIAQMQAALHGDLTAWLRDDYLPTLPGGLDRGAHALQAWRETVEERVAGLHLDEEQQESEADIDAWLSSEIDRIAHRLRARYWPVWLALPILLSLLGLSAYVWLSGRSGTLLLITLALFVLIALALSISVYRHRQTRARLLDGLRKDLALRLTPWLHWQLARGLRDLEGWLEGTQARARELRAALAAMAEAYGALGEIPAAQRDDFLDQMVLAPERCRELFYQVGLDALFDHPAIQNLPGRAIFPPASPERASREDVTAGRAELEPILLGGIAHVAAKQESELRRMSFQDALSAAFHLGNAADSEAVFADSLERLRARALPLHRYSAVPIEYDGHHPGNGRDGLAHPVLALPLQSNMLLVAEEVTDWRHAASEKAGSPDYLRPVSYAHPQVVFYVRAALAASLFGG